ncbi:MAG: hypothetical protein R3E76_10075 [Planctomycetota bacterium]
MVERRDYVLQVDVTDHNWYSETLYAELSRGTPEQPAQLSVVMSPAKTIRIMAMYDDNQPVTYMGALRSLEDGGFKTTFGLSSEGLATVSRVPIGNALSCIIFAGKRFGYGKFTVILSVDQLVMDREILIVVPKSESSHGQIRVEFTNGGSGGGSSVMIEERFGSIRGGVLYPNRSYWESGKLRLGRQYRVTIVGEKCWRSEWIELLADRVTVLEAELQAAATIHARLVDIEGNPIKGGALHISTRAYLGYYAGNPPIPSVPSGWLSDESGKIIMTGLPPGEIALEVEAWGKKITAVTTDLMSGGELDLGDIVLHDAVGEISISITGGKPDMSYVAYIADPDSVLIHPPVAISGDAATIKRLPLRPYVVVVSLAKGGTVVTQEVVISEGSSSASVQLDVSSVVP